MDRPVGWLQRESMNDDERRHALAHELGVPFVQLGRDISVEALVLIPEPLAREHNAVAFNTTEQGVEVAVLDLAELDALDFLRSRYRVLPRLTTRASLVQALLQYQKHLRGVYGEALQNPGPSVLDTLLRHALMSHASAVHLQLDEKGLLARYRIGGSLKDAMTLPSAVGKTVLGKLQALGARARVDLGHGEDIGLRIASAPTVDGHRMVVSLLRERAQRGWTLEALGLHSEALERVHHVLNRRRGLVTIAGVGKTTLLYSMLDILNSPEISIATAEERVGQALPRVSQLDIAATGFSMAGALRAALRTDPDVVALDTVADTETAQLAIAAASRGTLVVAAVAHNELCSAPALGIRTAVVHKLCDKKFLDKRKLSRAEADALEAAGARFANVLAALKEEGKVAKDTQWKDITFAGAVGCSECDRGYKGALGLQEVSAEGELIGLNLIEDGLFKAAQGLTSVEEVLKLQ